MNYRRHKFLASLLLAALFAAAGCGRIAEPAAEMNDPERRQPSTVPRNSDQLFFGNPSEANDSEADNYLLIGEGSVISYNNSRGTANWAMWRTTKMDLGPSLKRPEFRPDPRLPEWFNRVRPADYSGSGYDRGHLVPSADRFGNAGLNEETFLMTNIVPQTSALNQYAWEKFESFARGQARRGRDVYQIAGVYGTKEILRGGIAVPTNCWKIIAINPHGDAEPNGRTRIIAVDMPNEEGIEKGGWERFRTSVRAIEEKTGYDLFRTLPREVQDKLEVSVETLSP